MSAATTASTPRLEAGDRVELAVLIGDRTHGVVTFLDAGWVHWTDSAGRDHASQPGALRIRFPAALGAVVDGWEVAR